MRVFDPSISPVRGSRIGPAAREAALVAVDPEDPRVADVHRIHVRRRVLHLHGVPEAGRLERLVPPERAVAHRAARRLGNAGVEVEDDRRLRLAHRRRRVLLLEAPARDPLRLGVSRRTAARSRGTRSRSRRCAGPPRAACSPSGACRNEWWMRRVNAAAVRRHVVHEQPGIVGGEGRDRLDLGVSAGTPSRAARIEAAAVRRRTGTRPGWRGAAGLRRPRRRA